jgi:hypothetical protein
MEHLTKTASTCENHFKTHTVFCWHSRTLYRYKFLDAVQNEMVQHGRTKKNLFGASKVTSSDHNIPIPLPPRAMAGKMANHATASRPYNFLAVPC